MALLESKCCPHCLQLRCPILFFLSMVTLTDVSLLQNTHLNEVASGSRWIQSAR